MFLTVVLATVSNTPFAAEAPIQDGAAQRVLAVERAGTNSAIVLAKGGNLAEAEAVLVSLNRSTAASLEWRLESAQRLIHTAEQLAREAAPAHVPGLIARALAQLAVVDQESSDVENRAAAKTLIGFVHERYLADLPKALQNYEAAAELAPNSAQQAKEAAVRLKRIDDNLKARASRGSQ